MTDYGSCYRSPVFTDALGQIKRVWTRPCQPQTNRKVERFNRTLATEWAYRQPFTSNEERAAALAPWLNYYNTERIHTGIGETPISRVSPTS